MGRRGRFVRLAGAVALAAVVGTSLVAAPTAAGAVDPPGESLQPPPDEWAILRAGSGDANTSIPAPDSVGALDEHERLGAAPASFQVNYTGFPADARAAFQRAVDIWASLVSSPVPIVIDARWQPLDPGILGGARPTNRWRNFTGAPQPGTWYVNALANALAGSDLDPARSDITAMFASTGVTWYFGTDGHPPAGHYDFVTTVLHEIGHGLGFTKLANISDTGVGTWDSGTGSPDIYDRFVRNGAGVSILSFPNHSPSLGAQLESNDLFFSGVNADSGIGGGPIKLYAPDPWQPGTSISHFDEPTFPPGNPHSLMTPFLERAEAVHAPGPGALGVLEDLGWGRAPPVPVQRIHGQDAVDTSMATSQAHFGAGTAGAVVLARSDHFADALAGGPLAALHDAPLLITPGAPLLAGIDARVMAEIQRVLPGGRTVYVLGGSLAVAPGVADALRAAGYTVVRVEGANQYATAVAVAGQLGNPSTVFEATGLHFADSLSAVPAAIAARGAILLTNGPVQAPETAAYLAAHPPATRYAVGGPLAAFGADPGAIPVWGQDLFETSAAVAQRFFPRATTFGVATGLDFPDALSGGVFMGHSSRLGPMLLVGTHLPVPPSIDGYLQQATDVTHGYVFGGPLAVGDDVAAAL